MMQADSIELSLVGCRGDTPADKVDLSFTKVRLLVIARPVGLAMTKRLYANLGYIAGTGNGIVTINGVAGCREILLMDALDGDFTWVARTFSLPNGQYLIDDLDPSKRYLIMCRDLPPDGTSQRFEPAVWDYVAPATDLTLDEQQALWQQMANQASQA